MKYIYKLLSICLLGTFISCSGSWLDLDPSDGLPQEQAITNYNDAKVALTGVYDALQGSSSATEPSIGPSYYGARMIYYGDVKSDDMQATFGTARTGISYQVNQNSTTGLEIWRAPYKVILRANKLLEAIEEGTILDGKEADLNDMKGQMLTIRALAHFDLLRVYSNIYSSTDGKGAGIPIVTKSVNYDYIAGRNTIEEVYTQIIKDLTDAISLLNTKKNMGYINQWAAKALLARVYLYKGDNTNAYNTAVDVIENSGYTLWTTEEYESVWAKQGTSEVIFEITNYDTSDWVDRESIGYLYSEDGYADAIMTKNFVDFVNNNYPNDTRQTIMLRSNLKDEEALKKAWGLNKVFVNKYPGREGSNDMRVNNIRILRLSETYLIAAEAAAKTGDTSNAAKYLNPIVKRGNPNTAEVSAPSVDRILEERRIEFVGEGHRFFDLMRNNKKVFRYESEADRGWHLALNAESRSFDITYHRVLLPIPEHEINANSIIAKEQNPGY